MKRRYTTCGSSVVLRAQGVVLGIAIVGAAGAVACGSGQSAAAALEANLADSAQVTAKITYQTTFSVEAETAEGLMIVAQRPPERRVDLVRNGELESSLLMTSRGEVECTEGSCRPVRDPSLRTTFDAFFSGGRDRLLEGLDDYEARALEGRQIAGFDADCYSVMPKQPAISAPEVREICFATASGFLLSLTVSFSGGEAISAIEAVEVDEEVLGSDLQQPYE